MHAFTLPEYPSVVAMNRSHPESENKRISSKPVEHALSHSDLRFGDFLEIHRINVFIEMQPHVDDFRSVGEYLSDQIAEFQDVVPVVDENHNWNGRFS